MINKLMEIQYKKFETIYFNLNISDNLNIYSNYSFFQKIEFEIKVK